MTDCSSDVSFSKPDICMRLKEFCHGFCWKCSALFLYLSAKIWGNESHLFGRSHLSRPPLFLSLSLTHTMRQMLPRAGDQSTTIPATPQPCTFKCPCMLLIILTADGALCRTTPGLTALLTLLCFLGQLLLAALLVFLPYLSRVKLYDPSQFFGLEIWLFLR